jgi:hypothetical protein
MARGADAGAGIAGATASEAAACGSPGKLKALI